jgi:hypothetical protein
MRNTKYLPEIWIYVGRGAILKMDIVEKKKNIST